MPGSTLAPELTTEDIAALERQNIAPPRHEDNIIPFARLAQACPALAWSLKRTREPWEKTQDELDVEQKRPCCAPRGDSGADGLAGKKSGEQGRKTCSRQSEYFVNGPSLS